MLPELSPDMQRALTLYANKVRNRTMSLAEATARFAAHDAREGQPARANEWQQRLSAAAKAPAPAIAVLPVRRMTPKLRIER